MEAVAASNVSNVSKLMELFGDVTEGGDSMLQTQEEDPEEDRGVYYKCSKVNLIRIKTLNRLVYSALEEKKVSC
jgi:hypothetical protein